MTQSRWHELSDNNGAEGNPEASVFRTTSCRGHTRLKAQHAGPVGSNHQAGFTLTELLVTVTIIGIIASIAVNNFLDAIEKARLARCLVEIHGVQAAVWAASDNGLDFISAQKFWENSPYPGNKPGPYFYLLDGDPNAGHGNDLDGVDEENPGESDPEAIPIVFVIVCNHDHKWLADYVYATDDQPPQIVGGEVGGENPGYDRFIKWENGGPGGGSKGGGNK